MLPLKPPITAHLKSIQVNGAVELPAQFELSATQVQRAQNSFKMQNAAEFLIKHPIIFTTICQFGHVTHTGCELDRFFKIYFRLILLLVACTVTTWCSAYQPFQDTMPSSGSGMNAGRCGMWYVKLVFNKIRFLAKLHELSTRD